MRCPGQDTRFWKPGDVFETDCPACGASVEMFKDDSSRKCPACKHTVPNPRLDLGCLEWCQYADKCRALFGLKDAPKEEFDGPLVERVADAMKAEFGDDQNRIEHALSVYGHAKEILKRQVAEPRVVLAAALLHDIGIREAEHKHGSSAAKYQELEGPPIARRILEELGVDAPTVDHVCRIVGSHHSAGDIDTPEFRIVWDADWLVNLPASRPDLKDEELEQFIERVFKTSAGKQRALKLLTKHT